MSAPRHPLHGLLRWLWHSGNGSGLDRQIHVQVSEGSHGERTRVTVDHRIPSQAEEGRPRLRVTTRDQKLFRSHFERDVRDEINSASRERGRRLYCIDETSQEVIAALSYHIDDRPHLPVLITAIGQRIDGNAALARLSRAGAALLKQYLHVIGEKIGRGGAVDFDNGNPAAEEELKALGFRRAPRVEGRRPSGVMWRQDPVERD